MSKLFHRLPHRGASIGIATGGLITWAKHHRGDLIFAVALANAIGAAALSMFPDSAAAYAVGLHALDVTE